MQKTDFIKAVAEKAGVSQKETKLVVDSALDVITEQLRRGDKVTLTGFGTFEVRSRHRNQLPLQPEPGQRDSLEDGRVKEYLRSSAQARAVRPWQARPARPDKGWYRNCPAQPPVRSTAVRQRCKRRSPASLSLFDAPNDQALIIELQPIPALRTRRVETGLAGYPNCYQLRSMGRYELGWRL